MKSEKNSRKHRGSLLLTIGLLLIAAALCLVCYNMYDEMRAERSSRQVVAILEEYLYPVTAAGIPKTPAGSQNPLANEDPTFIPDYVLYPNVEMPEETIDGTGYVGVLQIPSLQLELPVIGQWSYSSLRTAPCRYSGSAYLDNLIICGHNYSSHFGNLNDLREGDIATFTDMDGNVFVYQMAEREILNPTDIEEMESGDWDLTLFTCTVGGKTRVTIRFERTAE